MVVWAPFPFVASKRVVMRPALIVVRHRPVPKVDFVWCAMVTNAGHDGWPGDISIGEGEVPGLPEPSMVRTSKIAMFALRVLEPLVQISAVTMGQVRQALVDALGLTGTAA